MGKIIIIHVYEEEQDSKGLKQFIKESNPSEDKELQDAIHDLCGTNEQEFNMIQGYN